MTRTFTTCAAVALALATVPVFGASATSAPRSASDHNTAAGGQEWAEQILDDNGIKPLDSHVGGQNDPESTAARNIQDTAKGHAARTSPWSDVGVTKVELSADMLKGMAALGKDYDLRVTTVAGGDHSSTSYHYKGTALDVDQIDGKPVSSGNSKVAKVKSACRNLGAVEILGPGDAGHDSHVHCAWKS
jgi:hypothetical protein